MGRKNKKTFKAARQTSAAMNSGISQIESAPIPPTRASRAWRITTPKAALIIIAVGFLVFLTGLANPFNGDDSLQIVNNVPIRSIANLPLFFEGSTFYAGQGLSPLVGTYYRPLMTTVFSLLYNLFGAQPIYFHVFQLVLCIASTVLLYLFFRYSFKPVLALSLSLIFLVHPINSQVAFAIPAMQDALFMFFGLAAIYVLISRDTTRSFIFVVGCLFLSLLSKETGILFVAIAFLYLLWFDKKRLNPLIGLMAIPVLSYLALKIHAVGLIGSTNLAPIDVLGLPGRLLTAPSIVLFYLTKFVFPLSLASGYYWTVPAFSVTNVLIPLLLDLVVCAFFFYISRLVRARLSRAQYLTYLFYAVWTVLGLLPDLQLIPLDLTAAETWFYFSSIGVLGMIGVASQTLHFRIRASWTLVVAVLIIGTLGIRTAIRGTEWSSTYTLAVHDIASSKDDYTAYYELGSIFANQSRYSEAVTYDKRSIAIYPTISGYNDLGFSLTRLANYPAAFVAYKRALTYGQNAEVYENLVSLTLVVGQFNSNRQIVTEAVQAFPHNSDLWLCLALLDAKYGDNPDAKLAIANAESYGQVPQDIYDSIMGNQPFQMNVPGVSEPVYIP